MDKTKYANAEVFNNYFGVQHYPIGMQLILAELDKYTLNQSVDELPKIAQMVNAKQDDDTDDESEAKEHDENKANETIELDMDEHDEEAKEIEENTTTNNRISRISPTGGQANSKAKTGGQLYLIQMHILAIVFNSDAYSHATSGRYFLLCEYLL
eukprot:333391_1